MENNIVIHRNYFGRSQFLFCDQHYYYHYHYQLQITFPVLLCISWFSNWSNILYFFTIIFLWLSFARSDFRYLLWLQWSNKWSHFRYYDDHIYLYANDHQKSGAIITLIVIFLGPWLQDHISGPQQRIVNTGKKMRQTEGFGTLGLHRTITSLELPEIPLLWMRIVFFS